MKDLLRRSLALGLALALALAFALAFGTAPVLAHQSDAAQEEEEEQKDKEESLPLEVADTLEFTVDEATWMSVDVSPDGKTLVFDLLGDLYTLPVEGGEATRIIGGMSFESQPRFSPDGRAIVFLSDRSGVENLWLADINGTNPRPISKDPPTKSRPQLMASPSWTPDGEYVLVSKARPPEGTFAVFLYHKDGGTGVRVGAPPPTELTAPDGRRIQVENRLGAVASPDGRFIYYAERRGAFNYNAQFPIWQIVRFDRETSETATITNAPGSAMRPVLSPDGLHLVYGTRFRTETALRVRNLDTGEERWLTHSVTRDDQESRASRDTLPGYVFTPDGSALIVPVHGKLHRIDFETGSSTEIPFRARVAAEIGPRIHFEHRVEDGPTVRARIVRWPRLSPDGTRLAFSAFNHVYVMDLPNGTPRRLSDLEVGEFMPSWSPDGAFIVFATWSIDGGHLYRMRSDGSGSPERLTSHPAFYSDPIYAPGGDKIVFVSGTASDQLYSLLKESREPSPWQDVDLWEIGGVRPTGALDLKHIPADGGSATLIASTKGGRFPHFTNDPERLYLTTSEGLTSVRIDGFDRRTHFKVSGVGPGPNPPTADEIRLSPDGRKAFVNLQNKHYVLDVPRAGKETIEIQINGSDSAVPVGKLSGEGGDYLDWSTDGSQVAWSEGRRFYRRSVVPEIAEEPDTFEVDVTLPRPRPRGTVALRGAERIITMRGDEILTDGDVVITDNRIASVGSGSGEDVPQDAEVIDVSGKTIMPGLVDVHSHMWAPRGVHQTQIWQYLANLAYGVTTTRDPQTSTDDVFAYADLVDAGMILGPRVYATGPGVFAQSGVVDQESADNLLERYADAYDSRTIKQYVVGDRIVRQWVAIACRKHGLTPTTEGALDLKLDLSQMADGYSGNEHSLPIIPIYDDVAQYVARTETYYTPTILVAYGGPWTENYFFQNTDVARDEKLRRFVPYQLLDNMVRRRGQWFVEDEYQHKGIAEGCTKIVRAGGKCGLGSHGQLQGIGAHWEIWALQSGGLTEHETLRAITLHGAEAIGLAQDLGSIEAGKLADILVLDENPLEDIRNTDSLRYVMKNGELFEAATLDQVWPEKKPLDDQFWWDDMPQIP
jgi:imidazolonepropionase-like amidohydrolase/Tol biopolymer transport system component